MSHTETMAAGSELRAQHERWSGARARLWGGPSRPSVIRQAELPAPTSEPELPWGAPVNLIGPPSPRTIMVLVALRHGVGVKELAGPSKPAHIVEARDEAIGLVWTHRPQMSLEALGRLFGRDHTTVLHALRKMGIDNQHYYTRRTENIDPLERENSALRQRVAVLEETVRQLKEDRTPAPLPDGLPDLTRHEETVLRGLLSRPGRVVPRSVLYADLYGVENERTLGIVSVMIHRLRRKLKGIVTITTTNGRGFTAELVERPAE